MRYKGPRYMPGTYLGLEEDWNNLDARSQYILWTASSSLPFIGPIIQAYDNMRYMDDYTRNRGIDYADIKYPSRTQGAQGLGTAVNFVSNNITRLYQEDERVKRRNSYNTRRRVVYYY